MSNIALSEIMNGAWKQRAISVCEERGIPSVVDGLKPSQRFLLKRGYKMAKTSFDKVAAIASTVAIEGYEHGETSAANALVLMTADYCNNLPLFQGDGNFGNRLIPDAAAPRYIFARLMPYIDLLFKDTEYAPEHPDEDVRVPLYYLPIIPLVLVNGIKGIATGYATDIPPHDPVSLIDWLIERTKTETPKAEIQPKYYYFTGDIEKTNTCYRLTGKFERVSPIRIRVTELPHGQDSLSYNNHLKKLQEKGTIVSYEDSSRGNNFDFLITLKKGTRWSDEDIITKLKLVSTHTWNLTTVDENGRLKVWDKETGISDIMEAFYRFRLPFVERRIVDKVCELYDLTAHLSGYVRFCGDVVTGKFTFRITDEEFRERLLKTYNIPEPFVEKVMDTPVRSFTEASISKASKKLEEVQKELAYYQNTTPEREYRKDLQELRKNI